MKILANAGNLSPELMRHYARLVDARISDDKGSSNYMIFGKNHAIKHPRDHHLANKRSNLDIEYRIGHDLKDNGLCVPEIYSLGETDKFRPFEIMEKLDFLTTREIKIKIGWESYFKKFREQLNKIHDLGYEPNDVPFNHAWSKKHNDVCFFDFEEWEGPRVEEITRSSLK